MINVNNKDICDYLLSLGLEIGECYFQKYETRTQLTVELKGKATAKQIRKVEEYTGTVFDNIRLNYNELEGSSCMDLMFIR